MSEHGRGRRRIVAMALALVAIAPGCVAEEIVVGDSGPASSTAVEAPPCPCDDADAACTCVRVCGPDETPETLCDPWGRCQLSCRR